MKKNTDRVQGKTWTFLIYPEDPECPPDWQSKFEELHLSGAYSVIHDSTQDPHYVKDPDKPDPKKHVHCILEFPQNMSLDRVKSLIADFHGPTPFVVYDKPRMYRYLSHLDDKDKKSYNPNEVTYFNVPYWEYINTQGGVSDTMLQICDYINTHEEILTYRDLMNHAIFTNNLNWISFISSHVFFFNSFLRRS